MSSKPTAENTTPEYMLRFPPWPAPPPGKKIIPFKEFKPVGIRISMDGDDDAPELDGLGIPTVPLLVKHGTDDLEKKRRKKKGGASQVTVADGKRNTWWEDWEELEDVRKKYYDPNTSPIDRVFQAGADFRGGRPWPSGQLGMRLNEQWDQFRNYVGLSPQAIVSKKKQQVSDDEDSDGGEGEAAPETQPNLEASETPHPAADEQQRKRKRRPSMPVGSAYEETETADAEEGLTWDEKLQMHYEDKDINMLKFLNDPEMNMRIFFSHYFRDRGLIWSEQRCLHIPILICFFLRYLLRSRVLPEHEKPLRRALDVAETARIELPLTHKMGRAVPDAFSDACKQCWGSRQPAIDWGFSVPADPADVESIESPETKRQKTDADAGMDTAQLDEAVKAAVATSLATGGTSDPFVIDSTIVPADAAGEGWANAGAWPDAQGAEGGWGAKPPKDAEEEQANWGTQDWAREPGTEAPPSVWDSPLPALLPLLGPTALPLTHEPGVVEWSTRRIVSVHAPLAPRKPAAGPEAVEEALERRMGRMVLAPWLGWDKHEKSDITRPVIPSTSRGAVVLDENGTEPEAPVAKGALKPHNPFKDHITVLVMPEVVDVLRVGMGIGAYWVEIVRQEGAAVSGKKGKKKERPRYWYIDQVMHILPSYHAEE